MWRGVTGLVHDASDALNEVLWFSDLTGMG
jgi:hypothetical protein